MSKGQSGAQKGLETIGGQRIIDRVAAALRGVTPELLLVANDPAAREWLPGARTVADLHPGTGGLAGVEAALADARGRDVLVVAWDMPFVTTPLLQVLIDAARAHNADVALPASDSPYGFEPFCAYYSARVLPELSRFLEHGGAARDFLHRLTRLHIVPLTETTRVGDPRRFFLNVNTPDDLESARAMAAAAE